MLILRVGLSRIRCFKNTQNIWNTNTRVRLLDTEHAENWFLYICVSKFVISKIWEHANIRLIVYACLNWQFYLKKPNSDQKAYIENEKHDLKKAYL